MSLDFLFLRSYGKENALARVQSDPLVQGLTLLGLDVRLIEYRIGDNIQIPENIKWLIVHYDDGQSIFYSQQIKKMTGCKIAFLASDIYQFNRYLEIDHLSDLMIAPTKAHQSVLESFVGSKVITVPESVDSISYGIDAGNEYDKNRACWFGYPESFEKSMKYIIERLIIKGEFDFSKLGIISAIDSQLLAGVEHLSFSHETFFEKTMKFGYSILSHFPYDCHINTVIKSPNKLITSIVRGMVPIVSDTENYREIMEFLNLEKLLLRKPSDFCDKLKKMEYDYDKSIYRLEECARLLEIKYSPKMNAQCFLNQL